MRMLAASRLRFLRVVTLPNRYPFLAVSAAQPVRPRWFPPFLHRHPGCRSFDLHSGRLSCLLCSLPHRRVPYVTLLRRRCFYTQSWMRLYTMPVPVSQHATSAARGVLPPQFARLVQRVLFLLFRWLAGLTRHGISDRPCRRFCG